MTRNSGAIIKHEDFMLPGISYAAAGGTNVITATSFTDLPTSTCVSTVTNPHATANMVTMVEFSAWMATSSSAVRCCPRVSGSTTIAAGVGLGGPYGWGEVPLVGNSANPQQVQGHGIYDLPPGTATFTMQAYRDSASGTQQCNYPVIRLIPLYFDI